jgi:hypothetical protein
VGFVAGGPSRTETPPSHPELDLMDSGAGRHRRSRRARHCGRSPHRLRDARPRRPR